MSRNIAIKFIVAPSLCLLSFIATAFGLNWFLVGHPVQSSLEKDYRNSGITFRVHWRYWLDPGDLEIDLESFNSASMVDIDRCLMQIASALTSFHFSRVYLSHKGEEKFALDGYYFRELGQEYGFQNPIYTARTLPENVETLGGGNAFPRWSGGLLGVVQKQMEDHAEFHKEWWAR